MPGDHIARSLSAPVDGVIVRRKTAAAAAAAADDRILKQLAEAWEAAQQPMSAEAQQSIRLPIALITGSYVTIGGLALGGGIVMGFRAFEGTAAFEALDKMEKPTPAAEAQAMRMATRALGWGTLLTFGSAAVAVVAARYAFDVKSAAEFGSAMRVALSPANDWLQETSQSANAVGMRFNSAVAGAWRRCFPRRPPAERS